MEVKLKIIKNALLFFCLFTVGVLFAQKTVNGTVKDSDDTSLLSVKFSTLTNLKPLIKSTDASNVNSLSISKETFRVAFC